MSGFVFVLHVHLRVCCLNYGITDTVLSPRTGANVPQTHLYSPLYVHQMVNYKLERAGRSCKVASNHCVMTITAIVSS